jgi:hypothetical protein
MNQLGKSKKVTYEVIYQPFAKKEWERCPYSRERYHTKAEAEAFECTTTERPHRVMQIVETRRMLPAKAKPRARSQQDLLVELATERTKNNPEFPKLLRRAKKARTKAK